MMPSKILYLGTDPSRYPHPVVHLPLIKTVPLPLPEQILAEYCAFTHVLLTSPNGATILGGQFPLEGKQIFAFGQGTEEVLKRSGHQCAAVAVPETQEGMIKLLQNRSLENSYLFYPRSCSARPLLAHYLRDSGLKHQVCDLYQTVSLNPDPLPDLTQFEEIVFTSPSTVRAFFQLYPRLPQGIKLTAIGPITLQCLTYLS